MALSHRACLVADYAIEFRTLAAESGWNEEALIAVFHQGLNGRLKDEVATWELWPSMARGKAPWSRPQGLLLKLPIPACPWSHISLDFVTGLSPSKGNMVILVLMDCFSKACKFVPLPKLQSAKETAELLLQHMVRIHGMPSDLGSPVHPVRPSAGSWEPL
ncbi:hypothetical protein MHYP_G00274990 [Metynnis hypsauchen]